MGIDRDRDSDYGRDVTRGGNPAQDQPGFNQDAAADTYPTRDTTGANQGLNQGIDQDYGQTGQGYDPNVAQGPGVRQDPAYNPGVNQGMGQDSGYTADPNQAINLGPASGSGMDQDVGTGGSFGSTDYDRDRDVHAPGAGGGAGGAMQRARGKIEETIGRMTNNPDLQQQGIDRQAQGGGQTGYGAPDTTDTTDTTNQGLTNDPYSNP